MTARTRRSVSLLISFMFPFSTLETVAMETPELMGYVLYSDLVGLTHER